MKKIKILLKYKGNNRFRDLKVFSRGINRQIIKWLETGDKDTLKLIKSEANLKPFSISYLFYNKNYYSFYINLLDDNLEKILIKGIEESEIDLIDLNYEKFELLGYETIKSYSISKLKEISKEKSLSKGFEISFLSETCFSQKNEEGKRDKLEDIEPTIKKIFRFLLHRISSENINIDLEYTEESFEKLVKIENINISNNRFILGYNKKNKMTISGFKGNIKFKFLTKNLENKKFISLMLLYSEWCGIGKKTSFGMGQVKVNFYN